VQWQNCMHVPPKSTAMSITTPGVGASERPSLSGAGRHIQSRHSLAADGWAVSAAGAAYSRHWRSGEPDTTDTEARSSSSSPGAPGHPRK